jgi:hypothetical protein
VVGDAISWTTGRVKAAIEMFRKSSLIAIATAARNLARHDRGKARGRDLRDRISRPGRVWVPKRNRNRTRNQMRHGLEPDRGHRLRHLSRV